MTKTAPLSVCLVLCTGIAATGIYVQEELRRVPVQRLAQNIERQISAKPDDVQLRLNLARLHAMAYALKATEFDARVKGDSLEAWFGHQPPHVPGPVRPPQSREHRDRARAHLDLAIKAYADVV